MNNVTSNWSAITAVQVICELQKALLTETGASKELAASVILRCNALCGELATDFGLPVTYVGDENQQKLEELAAAIGWA